MSDLHLSQKNLTTLKGQKIPKIVKGHFYCINNQLTSLEFGPKEVTWNYNCSSNQLTSLEFCANKIGYCLFVNSNSIENLKGIHKQFREGYIGDQITLPNNPLKSHLLGVILIPKLQEIIVDNTAIHDIINKHLKSGRDVLDCQEELIQNGLKEFAQL